MAQPRSSPTEDSHAARAGPDEAHAAACARVKQLQNAIDALDEKDPLVASLRAELQKARSSTCCLGRRPQQVHHGVSRTGTEARIGGKEGVGGCTGGCPGCRMFADEHRVLLERIPIIPDVQAAWLILSCCASAKSNFFEGVRPVHSGDFARITMTASGGVFAKS